MRIAQCLEFPVQQYGGTETIVRELIVGLAAEHEIILVSPDANGSLCQWKTASSIKEHVRWDPTATNRAQSKALAAALVARKIDIAHFHFGGNFGWGSRWIESSPLPHLARSATRVFSTVHSIVDVLTGFCGPQKPVALKIALLPAAWLGKMNVLFHVQKEIAVSQHDFRLLRRWYWPLRSRLTQVYHSRIRETELKEPARDREKLILNVGHLAWRKGQVVLVDAFAQIAAKYPAWKLALLGPTGEQSVVDAIQQRIHTLSLQGRIQIAGPQENTGEWMGRAAIYVQPSLEEALGLALQEAMAAGCACIGTQVGGIPELLLPNTGILVPPDDATALALSIQRLIEKTDEREGLGRAARASVLERGMTSDRMVSRYLQLYGVGT